MTTRRVSFDWAPAGLGGARTSAIAASEVAEQYNHFME